MIKPQPKIHSRLELIKGQYSTGAVGILRDQAEEMCIALDTTLNSMTGAYYLIRMIKEKKA